MDPPGQAMPDCLIAARIANNMERVLREQGKNDVADKFKGFDWKTEEDAFMDGYHDHEKGGEFVTYERLRAMGTNGFQEPATAFQGRQDHRHQAPVRRRQVQLQGRQGDLHGDPVARAAGAGQGSRDEEVRLPHQQRPCQHQSGRTRYLDQDNEFVMDRSPYPFIQMNPKDMADLKLKPGDLVEVYNDNGSTQAMAYPTPTAKPKQTFMLFAYPTGVQGNVVSAGVNEFIIPNYKQTWGNIRKLADAPEGTKHLTFKSFDYTA